MSLLYSFLNKFKWLIRATILIYIIYVLLQNSGLIPITVDSTLKEVTSMINNNSTIFQSVTVNEYTDFAYFYLNDAINNTNVYRVKLSKNENFGSGRFNDLPIKYTNSKSLISYVYDALFYWLIYNIVVFVVSYYISNISFSVSDIVSKDTSTRFSLVIPDENGIKFKDVIGHSEGKRDLVECVKFFKNRDKYIKVGYKIPKGLLLVGDPGTGKTLLAKAFANEANTNFIPVCGSDFIEMFVGVGQKRVKELFDLARNNSPCVIFIDEIDAVGSQRTARSSGHSEHGSTLNKLLSEIDGFTPNDNIMVIGATNRIETLDLALTRSGRFDKQIYFDPPNIDERKLLFELFTSKIQLDNTFKDNKNQYISNLGRMSAGLTGADIENICNQAIRMFMARIDLESDIYENSGVTYLDLEKAIDVVMIGMEKPERKMSEKEREIVAYHEAGHSLIAYVLKNSTVPIKVSIVPRGKSALGFTQQEPTDKKLHNYGELRAHLYVLLGGRAAEKVIYGQYSTGASDDIERATKLGISMVTKYGMSESIGAVNPFVDNYDHTSEYTKETVDKEIAAFISNAELDVIATINKHKNALENIAKFLLEKEVLLSDDMDNILIEFDIKNKY